MKLLLFLLFLSQLSFSQPAPDPVTVKEATRILTTLASDEMRGRKVFTPDIDRAADFIAGEFKRSGIQPLVKGGGFRQEFSLVRPKPVSINGMADGLPVDPKSIIAISCQQQVTVTERSGYTVERIGAGKNLQAEARKLIRGNRNLLVLVDKGLAGNFGNLARLRSTLFSNPYNIIFWLTDSLPARFSLDIRQEISEQKMANLVGIIPGKSRPKEYVIFSGHYDHLGVGKPENGDSIYNGANDDAAGITAVILLANYFKSQPRPERTLVFAAFTAEESGGFGSQYFSRQFDPAEVTALFNIEMIGTESKWGKNSAYITGYEKTDMGAILAKNLEGTGFSFYPDPYPQQQLFYRSDNATLARLGVPAHTISTSKMDVEPHYHRLTDEVGTLDLDNMTAIIRSIALSARSIIAGVDTPSRVKVEDLR